MKKWLLLLSVVFAVKTNAQTEEQKNWADAVTITGGGTFFKPKIMKELEALALAQVTVDFKTISSRSITTVEKKRTLVGQAQGKAATATVTSYLETTDGDLQPKDYQEIMDHFYTYFQNELNKNGIKASTWDEVSNTDFYKDADAEKKGDTDGETKGNSWVTFSAHDGKTIYSGIGGFAFMKLKQIGKMSKSLNAPVAFIHVVVDFAEIDVSVSVKTTGYKATWAPSSSQTTTMKSQTSVSAYMQASSFAESQTHSLVIDEKLNAENLMLTRGIPAEMDYATELTEDPSRMTKKNKLFSVSLSKKMESAPVIISTTISNYKAAAKKALERYADAIIAKAIVMKSK